MRSGLGVYACKHANNEKKSEIASDTRGSLDMPPCKPQKQLTRRSCDKNNAKIESVCGCGVRVALTNMPLCFARNSARNTLS